MDSPMSIQMPHDTLCMCHMYPFVGCSQERERSRGGRVPPAGHSISYPPLTLRLNVSCIMLVLILPKGKIVASNRMIWRILHAVAGI